MNRVNNSTDSGFFYREKRFQPKHPINDRLKNVGRNDGLVLSSFLKPHCLVIPENEDQGQRGEFIRNLYRRLCLPVYHLGGEKDTSRSGRRLPVSDSGKPGRYEYDTDSCSLHSTSLSWQE